MCCCVVRKNHKKKHTHTDSALRKSGSGRSLDEYSPTDLLHWMNNNIIFLETCLKIFRQLRLKLKVILRENESYSKKLPPLKLVIGLDSFKKKESDVDWHWWVVISLTPQESNHTQKSLSYC